MSTGDARASAGNRLRAARQARGLALESAAAELRLDPAQLRALEEDRPAELGAPVYARGHLRRYAALLGLPADELIEQSQAVLPVVEPPPAPPLRQRPARWAMPAAAAALAVTVVAALWSVQHSSPAGDPPAEATAGLALPATPPASAAPASAPAPVPVAAGPTAVEPPVVNLARAEPKLSFDGDCWIEVTDARGRRLAYELATAGSTLVLEGSPPWRVRLGDAGAVRLGIGDRELAIPPEAIRRNVAYFELGAGGEATPLAALFAGG